MTTMRIADSLKRFLRPVYWWYHRRWEHHLERKRRLRKWREIVFPLGQKVYLIGTPSHENLGDSAIVLAQKAFLRSCGWEDERIIELTDEDYARDWERIRKWVPKNGFIAQLGGGHLGNQWRNEENLHRHQVSAFAKNRNVIFPQTICYLPGEDGDAEGKASAEVYDGRKKLTMVAREKQSYDIMTSLYPNTRVLLTPDIVLSASMDTFGAKQKRREGVLLCLRSDKERSLPTEERENLEEMLRSKGIAFGYTDMYSGQKVTKESREMQVREKMEELASARLVITDRLHGMVFCALAGTPCIAMSSSNHKVRGTYEWISYLPYVRYAKSLEEVERYLPELLTMENCRYDNAPLRPWFDKLAEVVRKDAHN